MLFQKQVDRLAKLLHARGRTVARRQLAASLREPAKRAPTVEQMEPRLLLAADAIQIGAVYVEEDLGSDQTGDLFHITFQGGAEATELRRLSINGDLTGDGFSIGDLFFDTDDSGYGADHSFAFQVQELNAADPSASVRATVEDGASLLVLDFTHFRAGDSLIFSIDVDEVQFFDPNETDLARQNDNFDPITSGVEFQNAILEAEFEAPHYEDVAGTERFLNRYDDWLNQSGLPLPEDNQDGKRDRSAGAGFELQQVPKPVSLSGYVYVDANENLLLESGEQRLSGVGIELFVEQNGTFVSTGQSTTTDSGGHYSFGTNLNLLPGIYQVRETQPTGYYSVGATLGRIVGQPIASVGELVSGNPDILSQIDLSKGDLHAEELNFAENAPNSIRGQVCLVTSGDTCFDNSSGKEALADVLIELRDDSGTLVESTRTDSNGEYSFSNLRAGTYSITEVTPAGVIDGDARLGTAGGVRQNASYLTQIVVGGGTNASGYDFCEIMPSEISGHVYHDENNNGLREANEDLLSGVEVTLFDDQGNLVQLARTDSNGFYRFQDLTPGAYRLQEVTPANYLPGQANAGTIGGISVGQVDDSGDRIDSIELGAGAVGVNFDFGEILGASISGRVHIDDDGDCEYDAGEQSLAGVTIELLDDSGQVVERTQTDSEGHYSFSDLRPAVYAIREIQPDGLFQGGQRAGSGGGDDSSQDIIRSIDLTRGGDYIDYNFCELEPGSISGNVFADLDFDCFQDPNEQSLSGVEIQLRDASGVLVATTRTDSNGNYRFETLRPGEYSVHEIQPTGFFQGSQTVPTGVGDTSTQDVVASIQLASGQSITQVDFCEVPPAEITGYVFQDGAVIINDSGEVPEDVRSVRDGVRTADDSPIPGVQVELRTLTGAAIPSDRALPGFYSGDSIQVTTDANGFFRFAGLRSGAYHIYQTQPAGFEDGIDTPGTTTGFAVNQNETELVPSSVIRLIQLSNPGADPGNDAILSVAVEPGQVSQENNFSEVLAQPRPPQVPPPPEPPSPPPTPTPPVPEFFPAAPAPQVFTPPSFQALPNVIGIGHTHIPTWHLSVINGGFPRGSADGEAVSEEYVQRHAQHLDLYAWSVRSMAENVRLVSLNSESTRPFEVIVFDVPGAKPLAGDFDGDSYDELVLFADGEWFIDFNGNGRWDESDIWLKLGSVGDQPVIGDWDGDGKDDVGVFGPRWQGDDRALAAETGLPDPENRTRTRAKNLPPEADEAPDTPRLMKRNSQAPGRADLIDHVFRFGGGKDSAVSGDFNGDGISSIGTFRDGIWILDVDGDGELIDGRDKQIEFGAIGDIPVVGDFDGDGIDEIAVVRGNRVIVDSNDNGRIDATDQVFLLDSETGTVIVGDFDGDGRDEPLMHQSAQQRSVTASGASHPKA